MSPAVPACIGLGANLGDAAGSVRAAIAALASLPQTHLLRASRLYRTPAWGRKAQPDFINAAVLVETALAPRELLQALLGIEQTFGRVRTPDGRWGPRTLDLDLLVYGDARIDEPGLQVPHPYLTRRGFVLVPLLEIAPELEIPGFGPARNALSTLPTDEIANIKALSVDNSQP